MGYKQPSSGLPFKELGSSPAKQSEEFGTQQEREIDMETMPTLPPVELATEPGELDDDYVEKGPIMPTPPRAKKMKPIVKETRA